jgi:MFS family permease
MVYLIYTAVPFKAVRLGAGPFELGSLAAISTGVYAVLAFRIGHWSDRFPRTHLARASSIGVIAGCIVLTLAPSIGWMMAGIPLIGGSLAAFWPSVQASIGDRSPLRLLERNLGRFNLSWSTGKACGFLVGGATVAGLGIESTLTLASTLAFVIFFLLPGPTATRTRRRADVAPELDTGGQADANGGAAVSEELDARAAVFRRLAWIANGAAYGVSATLTHHYPRLIHEFGWSPRVFGLFLGLVYLTQAAAFLGLMLRTDFWRFRRGRLYAVQALALVCVVALPFADIGRLLVCALLIGVGLGTCYYSSIYYSLHTHDARGRHAGVHEGLIGLGSMLTPFLGGVVAMWSGHLAAPYAVAGGVIALALLAQEWTFRRSQVRRP